jgi:hypothetical protein
VPANLVFEGEQEMTDTDKAREIFFAISGPIIEGPNGTIDTEDMNLPSNDLISIIEWILSRDLGANTIPVAVGTSEAIYAVDQKRLRDVMKNYDSRQLRTVSSRAIKNYIKKGKMK